MGHFSEVGAAEEHLEQHLRDVRQPSLFEVHAHMTCTGLGASHLVESRCRGRAHSQGHPHKGIPMETVSVGHHDDACDGHYGSNNLREIHCYQQLSIRARFLFTCLLFIIISVKLCYTTDPDTHEAILENDPGQEKDKGLVAAVEGRHVSGSQLLQGQKVQVVGQRPQD